jgi:hypothetical protein
MNVSDENGFTLLTVSAQDEGSDLLHHMCEAYNDEQKLLELRRVGKVRIELDAQVKGETSQSAILSTFELLTNPAVVGNSLSEVLAILHDHVDKTIGKVESTA